MLICGYWLRLLIRVLLIAVLLIAVMLIWGDAELRLIYHLFNGDAEIEI